MSTGSSGVSLNSKVLLGVGVGLVAIGGAGYLLCRHLRRPEPMPEKWRRVGTVQRINLFPIKSCGVLVNPGAEEYDCDWLGLGIGELRDRKLMLLTEKNEMVTGRTYPTLLLIQSKMLAHGLVFSAPSMPDLQLDYKDLQTTGKLVPTDIFGAKLKAMLIDERFDKWFSQFILKTDKGLRLAYYSHAKPVRNTPANLKHLPHLTDADSGSFGDATSYMLMNLSSVADLNKRLEQPVDSLRFRGNFELKMDVDQPYAEDHWQWIRIGDDAVFRIVAPCTRCIMPNIHHNSGERDADFEPLKTLRSYRVITSDSSPVMGVHMGLRQPGSVKLNDVVYVADV
ncbi:mitochondrial amidoxime reducing component 2 [Drosophila busckii]|uniref:mitochondrial amidoxime reducing component 2 n=1 Tax=Drosophila busckii TaxID=30019 RepID=UPI00083F240A|nr:mitochondrial amidoxime reducing component 2 [Drosophila busckii]